MEASLAEQPNTSTSGDDLLDEIERTLTWLRADLDLSSRRPQSARAVEARSAALASAIATSLRPSRFRRPHRAAARAASARSRRPSGRRWTRWAGYVTSAGNSPSVSAPSADSGEARCRARPEAVQEAPKIPASFREGLAALERAKRSARRQPVRPPA